MKEQKLTSLEFEHRYKFDSSVQEWIPLNPKKPVDPFADLVEDIRIPRKDHQPA